MKAVMIFFMSFMAVLVFIATPAYADKFHSLTMEFGADRQGADYKNIEMESNDPFGCQVLCAQDSECKAYTFVPAGILTFEARGPIPRCYLKTNAQQQSEYKGLISGMKLGVADPYVGAKHSGRKMMIEDDILGPNASPMQK
ncbi:MAG: PAN domain-containing protein [Hormoscilla sp. GM7CHS1pb]|nr:PAN domain-containing protein [Hormoscilla sp. GM7CHS1pb]